MPLRCVWEGVGLCLVFSQPPFQTLLPVVKAAVEEHGHGRVVRVNCAFHNKRDMRNFFRGCMEVLKAKHTAFMNEVINDLYASPSLIMFRLGCQPLLGTLGRVGGWRCRYMTTSCLEWVGGSVGI